MVTREDSEQGRRKVLTPTAVAGAADELALPTIKANRLAGAATDRILAFKPDLGVIVAYGGLIREPLLSAPRLGWINLHFSLLPRWRGAAPVQRALMAGDEITGASVFQLVEALDAGPVFGQLTQSIGKDETAGELLDSLSIAGAELLLRVVDSIADGTARAVEQDGDLTLAPKLGIEDGRIRWSEHASTVTDLIRGVTPEPGAFTTIDDARLKILRATIASGIPPIEPGRLELVDGRVVAGTGSTPVELVTVHPAGKKAMSAVDWWRGRPAGAGVVAG
ncbi:MAG: methionyl-tRNA formyltransferase [Microbacteriaceae bacterium]|nr:methionyl-tRNA formyltransferase [Microbacteriaceae bacterium]